MRGRGGEDGREMERERSEGGGGVGDEEKERGRRRGEVENGEKRRRRGRGGALEILWTKVQLYMSLAIYFKPSTKSSLRLKFVQQQQQQQHVNFQST